MDSSIRCYAVQNKKRSKESNKKNDELSLKSRKNGWRSSIRKESWTIKVRDNGKCILNKWKG